MEDHPRPWLKMGKPPFWGRKSTSSFQAAERQSSRDEKNHWFLANNNQNLNHMHVYIYIYVCMYTCDGYIPLFHIFIHVLWNGGYVNNYVISDIFDERKMWMLHQKCISSGSFSAKMPCFLQTSSGEQSATGIGQWSKSGLALPSGNLT